MSVQQFCYHYISLFLLNKITHMLYSYFGIILTYIICPSPSTTTSSLLRFFILSFTVFTIASILAPGFMTLETYTLRLGYVEVR
jgi:hypothetical protein